MQTWCANVCLQLAFIVKRYFARCLSTVFWCIRPLWCIHYYIHYTFTWLSLKHVVKTFRYVYLFSHRLSLFLSLFMLQGRCLSCYAFSVVGALEGHKALASSGKLVSLSEQSIVDCSGKLNINTSSFWFHEFFCHVWMEDACSVYL